MVDQGALAGSGGYHRPCSAQARRRSSLTTPGWTTAIRSSGSMAVIAFIASKETTTHPSTALAPPDRPVPAPRATIGTPCSAHHWTIFRTSAVSRGRTTAAGVPYGAHSASSWVKDAITSGSLTSCPAGSRRSSSAAVPSDITVIGGTLCYGAVQAG